MPEKFTEAELVQRFPSEWIIIGDPELDEAMNLRGGTVIFHSSDRDEVDRKSLELRLRRFAVICTVPPPEHILINL